MFHVESYDIVTNDTAFCELHRFRIKIVDTQFFKLCVVSAVFFCLFVNPPA